MIHVLSNLPEEYKNKIEHLEKDMEDMVRPLMVLKMKKNYFAVQFGGFIEIETSYQVMVLFSKLKIIPNSCSMSLPRIKS